jgi:hypothetical protein
MSKLNNFFALLYDDSVRRINLTQSVISGIQDIFIKNGALIMANTDLVPFDGNYRVHEDEDELLFVEIALSPQITESSTNPLGVKTLDIDKDNIKALFWYEDEVYYFQNFDSRRLLNRKKILYFSTDTFDELKTNAFVIENMVNAIYTDKKFYFLSYTNANKIFSLSAFYHAATDPEISVFAVNNKIGIEEDWILKKANNVIRNNISILMDSKVLDTADTTKIKTDAAAYKLTIDLDSDGKIIFPKDLKKCKDILIFLNEQFFTGPLSGKQFRTNNKREIK